MDDEILRVEMGDQRRRRNFVFESSPVEFFVSHDFDMFGEKYNVNKYTYNVRQQNKKQSILRYVTIYVPLPVALNAFL